MAVARSRFYRHQAANSKLSDPILEEWTLFYLYCVLSFSFFNSYQGRDRAYLWLSDKNAIWWNLVVDKQQPAEIKGATIEIQGLDPGAYNVEWWHTFEGKTIRNDRASFAEGPLRISVPSFARDIACKITPTQ